MKKERSRVMDDDKVLYPSLGPRPSFYFWFREGLVRENTSFWTSVGVSMEMPPFTMTSFQSAYGQVVAWCEYSSSETDDIE